MFSLADEYFNKEAVNELPTPVVLLLLVLMHTH